MCGTSTALAVWKPAPSHASTACTPASSDAENCFKNLLTTPALSAGLISPSACPVAGHTAVSTHRYWYCVCRTAAGRDPFFAHTRVQRPLLAEARLVLEPHLDALGGAGRLDLPHAFYRFF